MYSIMRARSHKYPDSDDDKYIDTTYYDKEDEYLDLGYQRLKHLNIERYPEFSYLKKLFIDHNNLDNLPEAKYLPNLRQLTCSSNNLKNIPYYPNLTFLNIANNQIISCNQYNNSKIKYFDCSFNSGFKYDFILPECKHLYINDTETNSINLNLLPKLEILDCENNRLTNIEGGNNLLEINIQYNYIKSLPYWPKMERLMADQNEIEILRTYPNLISVNISHNKLIKINSQPLLKKLIANNNNIRSVGNMPELELIDLSHNFITYFDIPKKVKYISLQFNPLTKIILGKDVLGSIKELQVNFETYKHIYETYYHNFDSVNVQTNEEKLEQMLKKLSIIFNDSTSRYVFRKFNDIKFKDREDTLFKITLKLYWDYFSSDGAKNIEELVNSDKFRFLLENITNFYYKTIVITLYFNGYLN